MSESPVVKPSKDFVFGSVEGDQAPAAAADLRKVQAPAPLPHAAPGLGPLAPMAGSWVGTGFNTIFRPFTPKMMARTFPVHQPTNGPQDNVLELNLTTEQTSFTPIPGTIPNRTESDAQPDIFLTGMAYLQNVSDVTTQPPTGIHIEPGLWIVIPPTAAPPQGPTVARMASIPHGTTINAQGSAVEGKKGAPEFPVVDITPTPVGSKVPVPAKTFPSQTFGLKDTFRIPQDLDPFEKAKTITPDILADPNQVLRNIAKLQNFVSHTIVTIDTNTAKDTIVVPPVVAGGSPTTVPDTIVKPPILAGGGTANIAFLQNTGAPSAPPPTGPNALAPRITATFWIETVTKDVTLHAWKVGDENIKVPLVEGLDASVTPTLHINPGRAVAANTKVTITFTQIQYSQTVFLDFNGLSWPHVSVATLVPAEVKL